MKSSTLHKRSNLSKERVEALDKMFSEHKRSYDASPGVYIRSDKEQDLDILWQGFKINNKDERAPGVYLVIGFIIGAICMFIMTTILNIGNTSQKHAANSNFWAKPEISKTVNNKSSDIKIAPASTTTSTNVTKKLSYTIKSGDTLEKVALRYLGTASPSAIQKIQKANGLRNANMLQIGQKIIVPVE